MNEISYSAALESGIEPIHYRADILKDLGPGQFPGKLRALIWSRKKPCLFALVDLDAGHKVQVIAFQRHSRPGLPEYLGLRAFSPGQKVSLVVDVGPRGGMRPTVLAA